MIRGMVRGIVRKVGKLRVHARELMLELFISARARFLEARDHDIPRISWCRFRRGFQLALRTSALVGEGSRIHHLKRLTMPLEISFQPSLAVALNLTAPV